MTRGNRLLLAAIALLLLLVTDDRHAGKFSDGRFLIRTAVAIAETGEIGQARGPAPLVARPEGDAVSRYGLGMSLCQVPAALLAPHVDRAFGPGASQPLFLLAPLLLVLVSGVAAAHAARLLGASPRGETLAILFATVAGPLAAYSQVELSEPLQAAALAVAFAASLHASRAPTPKRERGAAIVAGLAASAALLAKSNLLLVAPFALVPLLSRREGSPSKRRLVFAALGAAPLLALWGAFEWVRFGRLLGGYGNEGFTHPPLDGLWRLLAGPNRGLLFYFPALVPAVLVAVAARRARSGESGPTVFEALGVMLPFLSLLAQASAWWAWYGVGAWGPRLLVPAVPLLASLAATRVERWSLAAGHAFAGISILLNLPPLLQHPTPVDIYVGSCRRARVDEAFASTLPPHTVLRGADGIPTVPPDDVLARVPAASPMVLLPWFLSARFAGEPADVARRLESPPWLSSRSDLAPPTPFPPKGVAELAPPPRWSFWGRGFFRSQRDASYTAVYLGALADQVVRAQELGNAERALALATKLEEIAPGRRSDALLVESYRLAGRAESLVAFASSLGPERRDDPRLLVSLALFARDRGDEATARRLLSAAAPAFPGTAVGPSVSAPLAEWPKDMATMTEAR